MDTILSIILLPLLFALLIYFAGRKYAAPVALAGAGINLFYFLFLLSGFRASHSVENVFNVAWIPGINANLHFGLDTLGIFMILLTALVLPIGLIASLKYSEHRSKGYYILMLLGLSALNGFFSAQNDITFYVFFELALIPFYFIVLMYGGAQRRQAVFKFFVYTVFGSFLMLGSIIYLHSLAGQNPTNDWTMLYDMEFSLKAQTWMLAGLFVAFAIKSPLFPFHTWQADLYTEGDRPTIIIIAAVLSKMGVFGILRFFNVVNEAIAQYQLPLLVLCIAGVLYGALVAWRQSEVTRVMAYSSLSHMGMIAAGIFTATVPGLKGGVFQMLSHGLIAAGMFFVADSMISRTLDNGIDATTGMARSHPNLAVYFFVLCLASVGLPLTSGFIGEFNILQGLSQIRLVLAALAGVSVILGALYTFRMYQRMMFGTPNALTSALPSLKMNEDYVLIILMILVLVLGFYPDTWLDLADQATASFLQLKPKG